DNIVLFFCYLCIFFTFISSFILIPFRLLYVHFLIMFFSFIFFLLLFKYHPVIREKASYPVLALAWICIILVFYSLIIDNTKFYNIILMTTKLLEYKGYMDDTFFVKLREITEKSNFDINNIFVYKTKHISFFHLSNNAFTTFNYA